MWGKTKAFERTKWVSICVYCWRLEKEMRCRVALLFDVVRGVCILSRWVAVGLFLGKFRALRECRGVWGERSNYAYRFSTGEGERRRDLKGLTCLSLFAMNVFWADVWLVSCLRVWLGRHEIHVGFGKREVSVSRRLVSAAKRDEKTRRDWNVWCYLWCFYRDYARSRRAS